MVRRHTRHKSMTDSERECFLREATEAHDRLLAYILALSPIDDDYRGNDRASQPHTISASSMGCLMGLQPV